MKRQSKLAAAGITGAMLIGAGTGVVLNLPAGAGATSASTATSIATSDSTTPTTDATPSTGAAAPDPMGTDQGGRPDHHARGGEFLKTELDALVKDGTITQAQEDSILAGIEAALPTPPTADQTGSAANPPGDGDGAGGPGFGGPHGGMGGRGPGFGGGFGLHDGLDAAATALGVTSDELKADLQGGKTIADVAKERGVDVQKVIDTIVAAETATLAARVTDAVNGVRPTPPAGESDGSVPATGDTTPTTTG